MSNETTIWGREVTLDKIKLDITAIEDGYTVTATVLLDGEDVLYAHTEYAIEASFEEASTVLGTAAVENVLEWLRNNA